MDLLVQYANVFIPLGIALVSAWVSIQIYKEKINNIQKDVDYLKNEARDLRDRVIACEILLTARSKYFAKKNPLSLTEEGTRLLQNSSGKLFITENFETFFTEVEKETPKTAYDIQVLSRKVLKSYENDDRFIPLKEYAFKEGLELDLLIEIMGIELRDLILKKKGWDVSDVDKHDPSQNKSQ